MSTPAQKEMIFKKDVENKKIHIEREFEGNLARVWSAWTKSDILDKWWAPKPWKAETKTQDFKEGGSWHYAMVGPEGEKQWARADYKSITPERNFVLTDAFCDDKGTINKQLPECRWEVRFSNIVTGTKVEIDITFASKEDVEKLLETGFKEGFGLAQNNLDELLAKD